MNKTNIEWVKNPDGSQGYTWNPITGCLNGCPYCYAKKLANGRLRERYTANENIATVFAEGGEPYHKADKIIARTDPFYPRFWEDKLFEPMKVRKTPKGIFVCDMSDMFGVGVPEQWTDHIITTIKCCPNHRFYLLTKQPQNLVKFSPFPENCWVGVTATDRHFANQAQKYMLKVEAKVKYLSIEPCFDAIPWELLLGYNQVIIGAQTKPYKPPKIEWVQEIVEACDKAGVPVFLKDSLGELLSGHGEYFEDIPQGDHPNYESIAMLRQELPR